MKIKLIKGWNGQSAGAIIEPRIDAVGTTLIERGYAVEVTDSGKAKPKAKPQEAKIPERIVD